LSRDGIHFSLTLTVRSPSAPHLYPHLLLFSIITFSLFQLSLSPAPSAVVRNCESCVLVRFVAALLQICCCSERSGEGVNRTAPPAVTPQLARPPTRHNDAGANHLARICRRRFAAQSAAASGGRQCGCKCASDWARSMVADEIGELDGGAHRGARSSRRSSAPSAHMRTWAPRETCQRAAAPAAHRRPPPRRPFADARRTGYNANRQAGGPASNERRSCRRPAGADSNIVARLFVRPAPAS
jgi:hypothetical protein